MSARTRLDTQKENVIVMHLVGKGEDTVVRLPICLIAHLKSIFSIILGTTTCIYLLVLTGFPDNHNHVPIFFSREQGLLNKAEIRGNICTRIFQIRLFSGMKG